MAHGAIGRDNTGFPLETPGSSEGRGQRVCLSSSGHGGQQVPGQGSAIPCQQAVLPKASVH